MNLLLVEPGEVVDGVVALADRRADHLRSVLGVTVGARVRIGVIGGGVGTAEVVECGERIVVRVTIADPPPAPLPVELVLAVPRPKVLARVIEAAASFAIARITLTNAWRVDKSYLDSPRLAPDALALAARLGAEQGATTHLPPIALYRRLMPLLDERWPAPVEDPEEGDDDRPRRRRPRELRLLAHPGGMPIERAVRRDLPVVLAIGPEGGWIAREVDTFVARGFTPVALGTAILRVETAVAAALGQLTLLERVSER